MIFKQVNQRTLRLIVVTFLLLLLAPAVYLWLSAPPDPTYKGERLSVLLYDTYYVAQDPSQPVVPGSRDQKCREALAHLGYRAAPLIASWKEDQPGRFRSLITVILINQRIRLDYFTANRRSIVNWLHSVPEAAVALSEGMQNEILQAPEHDRVRRAMSYAALINSTDAESRKVIATRSTAFIAALLDRYEQTSNDSYELALVNFILRDDPAVVSPDLKDRIVRLAKTSRYLSPAEEVLSSSRARK